jgi:hypothetical protein
MIWREFVFIFDCICTEFLHGMVRIPKSVYITITRCWTEILHVQYVHLGAYQSNLLSSISKYTCVFVDNLHFCIAVLRRISIVQYPGIRV